MQVGEMVGPLEKLAESRAAMAVLRFLLGGQFCEGLFDLRKEEQRIVTKAVRAARRVQQNSLRLAVKCRESMPVAGDSDHANEAAGAVLIRNVVQLAQQAGIVGLVVGVAGFVVRTCARRRRSGPSARRERP